MAPPPNPLNFAAGITSVPKAFWDSWKSKHQSMFAKLSKSGVLFEAKNDNDAKAKAIDVLKEPTRFEPLNPKKLPVAGVTKAEFLE